MGWIENVDSCLAANPATKRTASDVCLSARQSGVNQPDPFMAGYGHGMQGTGRGQDVLPSIFLIIISTAKIFH
jgi:hypoxanthine-guanine phosphoribosyltransferase